MPMLLGQKILDYSSVIAISLLLLFCLATPTFAQQQEQQGYLPHVPKRDQKKNEDKEPKEFVPFYNGIYWGVDIYGLGAKVFGGDFLSSEVSVGVNLKNKFIPTVELGLGTTDTWSDNGINYKSTAPYFKIGVDYNTMANKKDKSSFLYVGLRYGFSPITYDIYSLGIKDPIYGGEVSNPALEDFIWDKTVPYDHPGQKATVQWFEAVVGVNVKIYKSFHMGWSARMKWRVAESISEYGNPWYVPGFGKYNKSNLGITYSLIYKLH